MTTLRLAHETARAPSAMVPKALRALGVVIPTLLVALVPASACAADKRHAVLIGVSQYPSLKGRDLEGPRNDVQLMHETLRRKGFGPDDIIVVADGVPAGLKPIEPTRANILGALEQTIAKLAPGDFLYVQFSGHGSQQPERVAGQEPDGLDEIFLARDVTAWDGRTGKVSGAIVDDEIGALIRRAGDRGANVWSVFDTCHSGSMTRGLRQEVRRVPAVELGIPGRTASQAAPQTRGEIPRAAAKSSVDSLRQPRAVAFFAAPAYASTSEFRSGLWGDATYGLFTHTIAEGLQAYPGITYRQLGQFVHQRYGALNVTGGGTPYYEGDLDVPVFGDREVPRLRQWPVRADDASLWIDAGSLSLFAEGAMFALVKDPRTPSGEVIGQARAVDVGGTSARLIPVKADGRADTGIDRRSMNGIYARLIDPNPALQVRVAVRFDRDAGGRAITAASVVTQAIDALKVDSTRGPRVVWVGEADTADIELRVTANHIYVRPEAAALIERGPGATPAVPLPASEPTPDTGERLQADLKRQLRRVARATNLLRVANQYAMDPGTDGFRSRLLVQRGGTGNPVPIDASDLPELSPGDVLAVEAENLGRFPVDVTILAIDANYGVQALFPTPAHPGNRLQPGSPLRPLGDGAEVGDDAYGIERLVVLATRQEGTSGGASDFRYLADDAGASPATRGVGGAATDGGMLDRAMLGTTTSTRGVGRRQDTLSVQVFSWRTIPRR